MRNFVLSWAALVVASVLAVSTAPARADQISLQYNTFGGNTPTTEGPLTPDMGSAVVNGNSAILTSNNAEVGAVWMDTGLSTHANFVSLKSAVSSLPRSRHLADFRLETSHFERAPFCRAPSYGFCPMRRNQSPVPKPQGPSI